MPLTLPKTILPVRILVWLICVLCFSANIAAQYRFDSWTTDDGLPQNSVRTILQTSDGYLWFTTLDGLVRFDGVKFTVFNKSNSSNLPGNRFINLFAEADDTLWICTEEQGVVRYRNGEFQTFTTLDGLPSDAVLEVSKDSGGSLFALTRKGAARFDENRFTAVSSGGEMLRSKRFSARSGTDWEINENSLTAAKNGQKTIFDLPASIKKLFYPGFNFFLTVNLFEDRQGDLWMAANNQNSGFLNGKLYKFSSGKFEEIIADGMPKSLVLSVTQDRRGNLWFSTERDGACRLSENRFFCFTPENGLTSKKTRDILKDREGTLWITTEDKGIYRLNEQAISSLSTSQGLAEKNAYTIFEDKNGAVWIGSYGGLAKFSDGKFTNYGSADGLIYPDVQTLFEDGRGRLWIGCLNGIEYLENGKFHDFGSTLGLESYGFGVFDVHQDRNGILWFASSVGLIRYDGESARLLTVADGLPGNNVKAMIENEDGSFWIGTYSGIALLKDEKFTAYTEKDGLAGNHVRSLYKDDNGVLWIGTYDSGLSRFKNGEFTNYTTENGLASNGVFQILEDAGKNFWMSSNQGIYRVSRAQLDDYADGKRQIITSTIFGKSDGMLSTEANGGGQPAGTKTRDGKLWFPTQDGAAIINPEAVAFNYLPPPVVIENARIDNVEQSKIQNLKSKIELLPGQENLEIDYAGLSFIKPEQVRFRYRLENLDENWTEAENRRTAFYPHLAPGEYVFHVIAANSDNVWNEEGAKISVVVKPYFYQTQLFLPAATLLILLLIYLIYRREIARFQKAKSMQEEFSRRLINAHESERRRIAAELHDSIGQTLAMIKNRATFGGNVDENKPEAQEQFDKITTQTTQAISEVREISYNLRPYLLDRLGLVKAIKSFVNKFEEVNFLKVETDFGDVDNLFSKEAELNIYRIIQESLNNIGKHSEATHAILHFVKSGANIIIKIEDNGRGFDKNAPPKPDSDNGGFGILGISERVRMLGGTLEIETAVGKGTKITIKINTK